MKIYRFFLETILPVLVGTLLFMAYFFITDKFSNQPELESCEKYELSVSLYLLLALGILSISILYQVIFGNWILKRVKNNFVSNIFNSIVFGTFFTFLFIVLQMFLQKTFEVDFSFDFFIAMIILGLIFSLLRKCNQRMFEHKFPK